VFIRATCATDLAGLNASSTCGLTWLIWCLCGGVIVPSCDWVHCMNGWKRGAFSAGHIWSLECAVACSYMCIETFMWHVRAPAGHLAACKLGGSLATACMLGHVAQQAQSVCMTTAFVGWMSACDCCSMFVLLVDCQMHSFNWLAMLERVWGHYALGLTQRMNSAGSWAGQHGISCQPLRLFASVPCAAFAVATECFLCVLCDTLAVAVCARLSGWLQGAHA
jgi:hypothetical protein